MPSATGGITGPDGSFYLRNTAPNGSLFAIINGTWVQVSDAIKTGNDLTNIDQDLTVAGGYRYYLRAGTLSAARAKTLKTTGATDGMTISIYREDVENFAMTVKNNAGTVIYTFLASVRMKADFIYNSDLTDWEYVGCQGLT